MKISTLFCIILFCLHSQIKAQKFNLAELEKCFHISILNVRDSVLKMGYDRDTLFVLEDNITRIFNKKNGKLYVNHSVMISNDSSYIGSAYVTNKKVFYKQWKNEIREGQASFKRLKGLRITDKDKKGNTIYPFCKLYLYKNYVVNLSKKDYWRGWYGLSIYPLSVYVELDPDILKKNSIKSENEKSVK